MKVDLSRDPLFEHKDNLSQDFKQRQREKHKQMRSLRNPGGQKKMQLNIQIVDPLLEQLHKYKNEVELKKFFQSSKASQRLKKYIIEQQRNLKCVRLQKIDTTQQFTDASSRIRRSVIKLNMNQTSRSQSKQKQQKQINIPKIQQLFKNQQKQYVLFESRMMRNQLTKAISKIDAGVTKLKSYSSTTSAVTSMIDSKKNTVTDRFLTGLQQNQTNPAGNSNEEDYEIDKLIERKMMMSKKLRDRLYRERKQMMSHQSKEKSQSKNLSFFINIPKKQKKKVILQGVKSNTFFQGDNKTKITPASSLLYSMNKMSHGRAKKQIQLQGLIQNSFQNRQSILSQKSNFYQHQSPFNNLSPSNQFKLRQLMDKKLMHRLQLSKQQVNNFTTYLSQIKQYHVILNDTILQILREVRQTLLSGKVMKISDLAIIVQRKDKEQLIGHPNQLIVQKLYDMMI